MRTDDPVAAYLKKYKPQPVEPDDDPVAAYTAKYQPKLERGPAEDNTEPLLRPGTVEFPPKLGTTVDSEVKAAARVGKKIKVGPSVMQPVVDDDTPSLEDRGASAVSRFEKTFGTKPQKVGIDDGGGVVSMGQPQSTGKVPSETIERARAGEFGLKKGIEASLSIAHAPDADANAALKGANEIISSRRKVAAPTALDEIVKSVKELNPTEAPPPTTFAGKVADATGRMAAHPVETAKGIALAPLQSGFKLGEYVRQEIAKGDAARRGEVQDGPDIVTPGKDVVSGKEALMSAAQLASLGAAEPVARVTGRLLARPIGSRAAAIAGQAASGGAIGAAYDSEDPAVGGAVGGLMGALHAAVSGARTASPFPPRQKASETGGMAAHPDRLITDGPTPRRPTATVEAKAPATAAEPDFVVKDDFSPLIDKVRKVVAEQREARAAENARATEALKDIKGPDGRPLSEYSEAELRRAVDQKLEPVAETPPEKAPSLIEQAKEAVRGATTSPAIGSEHATAAAAPEERQSPPSAVAGRPGADVAAGSRPVPDQSPTGESGAAPAHAGTGAADLAARPALKGTPGKDAPVFLSNGGSVKAKYAVVEADDLDASHDPMSFAINPRYPEGVQGRAYHGTRGAAARQHVEAETGKIRPEILLDAGGGLTDGPSLVTPHGVVVAGNQRAMMLKRAAKAAPAAYDRYRKMLEAQADQYGVPSETIAAMRSPVLVRVINDERVDVNDPAALGELNRISDQAPTKTKDQISEAMSRVKAMGQADEALTHLNESLDPESSIRDYLGTDAGHAFARALIKDGVIMPQEVASFFSATKHGGSVLNAEGKQRIEDMLTATAIGDAEILSRAPASALRKIQTSIPAIITANRQPEYALGERLGSALDLLASGAAMPGGGSPVDRFLGQRDMFSAPPADDVVAMAHFLESRTQKDVAELMREYAKIAQAAADVDRQQETVDMFGFTPPPPEPADKARERLFTRKEGRVAQDRPQYGPSSVTETPAFKRWFKESKVVDENGEPLVVYHGTSAKSFRKFNTEREGAHFGTREQAEDRLGQMQARGGGGREKVIPVYLSIQNPLRMPDIGRWSDFQNLHTYLSVNDVITPEQADKAWEAWQKSSYAGWDMLKEAIAAERGFGATASPGFDGIVYENEQEGTGDSWIAFFPHQIKHATNNRGTFSTESGDILRQDRPQYGDKLTPFDTPAVIAQRRADDGKPFSASDHSPEMEAFRQQLVADRYGNGARTKGRQAWILLGYSGAGKSTIADPLLEQFGALLVDADEFKPPLREFLEDRTGEPWSDVRVHADAAALRNAMVERAGDAGDNIVWPQVGHPVDTVKSARLLKQAGYTVHAILIDVPIEVAAQRAVERFEDGGHGVDPALILKQGTRPADAYEALKQSGVDSALRYDNDVPRGHDPILTEASAAGSGRPEGGERSPRTGEREAPADRPPAERTGRESLPPDQVRQDRPKLANAPSTGERFYPYEPSLTARERELLKTLAREPLPFRAPKTLPNEYRNLVNAGLAFQSATQVSITEKGRDVSERVSADKPSFDPDQADLFDAARAKPDGKEAKALARDEAVKAFGSISKKAAVGQQLAPHLRALGLLTADERAAVVANAPVLSATFTGLDVSTPTKLRAAASIIRHPFVEHLSYVLRDRKTGKALEHVVLTSGAVNFVRMDTDTLMTQIAERVAALGGRDAVDVIMMHNHPSGDPEPSGDDRVFHGWMAREFARRDIRYAGHMILDHDRATWLDVTPEGNHHRERAINLPGIDDKANYRPGAKFHDDTPWGKQFNLDRLTASLRDAIGPDGRTLFYMDGGGRIVAVAVAPASMPIRDLGDRILEERVRLGATDVIIGAPRGEAERLADGVLDARKYGQKWAHYIQDILRADPQPHGAPNVTSLAATGGFRVPDGKVREVIDRARPLGAAYPGGGSAGEVRDQRHRQPPGLRDDEGRPPEVRQARDVDLFGNSEPESDSGSQESLFAGESKAGKAESRDLKSTERAARAELEKLTAQEKGETSLVKLAQIRRRMAELSRLVNRDKAISADELKYRASETDAPQGALPISTEPPVVGATDAEVHDVAEEFEQAERSQTDDGFQVTHVFDAPKKGEIVRINDKVKVYVAKHGWMSVPEARAKIEQWKEHAQAQGETSKNYDRVVLSLFDMTGEWSKPWEEAGYQVHRFDIQNDPENGDVNKFSVEFFNDLHNAFDGMDIYAILTANPCTDFASSGARHFAAKDARGQTLESVELVHQTMQTIEFFKPAVWALENPVGRIETLTGLPPWRTSFDPNHFGDPYTKKTLLWGRHNGDMPIAPVEPTEGSKMHQQYGGKSQKTKNARSATPEGFAYAFFMANNAVDNPAMAIANKYDRLDRSVIEAAVQRGVTEQEISEAVDDFYYMELDDARANQAIRALRSTETQAPSEAPAKFNDLGQGGFFQRRPEYGEEGATDLPIPVSKDDVPYDAAYDAYRNSSMSPDRRAAREQEEYVQHLRAVYVNLRDFATTPELQEQLAAELTRYKEGYLKHLRAWLGAMSRTASWMVTGPANFNNRRNEKANASENNRRTELIEWSKRAQKAMWKALAPLGEGGPISSDDPNAIEALQAKVDAARSLQENMKAANKIILKKGENAQKIAEIEQLGFTAQEAREAVIPRETWMGQGFPSYRLSNNLANVKRMEGRIAELTKRRGQSSGERPFEGGRVVENVEDNRIQILFDQKPDRDMIEKLKRSGFRWAPSNGAWQRQLTDNARYATGQILGIDFRAPVASEAPTAAAPASEPEPIVPTEEIPDEAPPEEPTKFDDRGQGALFQRRPKYGWDGNTNSPAFREWFGDSKVVDKDGKPLRVYHGAQRSDRFGPVLLKKRATSGPMPFFTDDPEMASSYAEGKADTSIPEEEGNYEAWYRLKFPGERKAINLADAWWHLTDDQRQKITALGHRVGTDDAGEEIILHPEGHTRGHGGFRPERHGGNALAALVDGWLSGGTLFNEEFRFHEVLKLAGVPMGMVEFHDPHAALPGVAPAYLSIQNPLNTGAIPDRVYEALEAASRRQRKPRAIAGRGDSWSKSMTGAQDWINSLNEDREEGTSYAWTVIPDWVTAALSDLGYDGLQDTGGKRGGDPHAVWVPFEPQQVKSAIANRGTFDPTSANILRQDRPEYGRSGNLFGDKENPEPLVGIKNDESERTRLSMGLPERNRPEPRTQEEMYDAGKAEARRDPLAISRLMNDLRNDPERIVGTETEAGLMLKHRVDLDRRLNRLVDAQRSAKVAGDTEQAHRIAQELVKVRSEIVEFITLAERTGTATARALAARKMMSGLDYSLGTMEAMAEAAKGSPLTDRELERIKGLYDELHKRLELVEKDATDAKERAAKAEADRHHTQMLLEALGPTAAPVRTALDAAAESAKARLRARGFKASAGMDPADLTDHAIIGAAEIARGTRKFGEWSVNMTKIFGDAIRPHLEEIFEASTQKLAEAIGKSRPKGSPAPKKKQTGAKKAKSEDGTPATLDAEEIIAKIADRYEKGDIESMYDIRSYLRELALWYIRAGLTKREPLLDQITGDVREAIPDARREEVRDALSGYGMFRALDRAAEKVKLRELSAEMQKLAQLEALERKQAPLATGFERQEPSAEVRRLTKIVNDAKRKLGIFNEQDQASRLKSALSAAKTRTRNAIVDLQAEIDTGVRTVAGKRTPISDPELEMLRAQLEDLRKVEEQVFGPRQLTDEQRLSLAKTAAKRSAQLWADRLAAAKAGKFTPPNKKAPMTAPEIEAYRAQANAAREEYRELVALDPESQKTAAEKANQMLRARLARQEADLLDRMARSDFLPRPKKAALSLDQESIARRAKVAQLKRQYQEALREFERQNRSLGEKVWHGIKAIPGTAKSLKASLDMSALLRQGLRPLLTHPQAWFKASAESFVQAFKALGESDTESMDKFTVALWARPNAELYRRAKLALTEAEEAYPSSLPEKIPGLGRLFRASQASFTAFQYQVRAEIFDTVLAIAKKAGVDINDTDQLRSIGKLVNSLTGRAHLGRVEPTADVVNVLFFAPRSVKAHFDVLTGHTLDREMSPFARKQAGINLLKIVAALAAVLVVVRALWPDAVDEDPRSADFGQIRVGNTRFNISGGIASLLILASRLVTRETKSSTTGAVHTLNSGNFGAPTGTDLVYNFFENKLSPAASLAKDLLEGRDFAGKPITVKGELVNAFAPLPITNYQELKNDPHSAPIVAALLADAVGIGTNTYGGAKLPRVTMADFQKLSVQDAQATYDAGTPAQQRRWEHLLEIKRIRAKRKKTKSTPAPTAP